MYVRTIRIQKYRHLENITLGPFDEPPGQSDLVALAGSNGSGKSSILELIGLALSNSWSLSYRLSRSTSSSSFEIELAITNPERKLIEEYLKSAPEEAVEVIDQVHSGTYFRAFDYPDGEYAKHSGVYNNVHNLVTHVLRQTYKRPLGFLLPSDRHYNKLDFDKNRLLEKEITKEASWGNAFNTAEAQYKDIFEFLVSERYRYYQKLGKYHAFLKKGERIEKNEPQDPLADYSNLLTSLFPDYSLVEQKDGLPDGLYVKLPTGEEVPFNDLSSGEKEVFFILSFFLRQNVSDAIILIDEPELHLHPELARLLVRKMLSVKSNNQIWIATHNGEVIDEAGLDRTIFIERDPITRKASATSASNQPEGQRLLRELFGFAGYIGIGRRMLFLEGTDSSLDRKLFARLLPDKASSVKILPIGGVANAPVVNKAVLSILEDSAPSAFYLIRDRDYMPSDQVTVYEKKSGGRIYILKRHQIENYLLDPRLLSMVLDEIYDTKISPEDLNEQCVILGRGIAAEVLRAMVEYRFSLECLLEDFSLGGFGIGQDLVDQKGELIVAAVESLKTMASAKAKSIHEALEKRTLPDQINALVDRCVTELLPALKSGSEQWQSVMPGKKLLHQLAKAHGIKDQYAFQNYLVKQLASKKEFLPVELKNALEVVATGGSF